VRLCFRLGAPGVLELSSKSGIEYFMGRSVLNTNAERPTFQVEIFVGLPMPQITVEWFTTPRNQIPEPDAAQQAIFRSGP